MISHVLAEI